MGDDGRGTRSMSEPRAPALDARTAALVRVAAAVGRPGLDAKRRELCTVATPAVLSTAAQLHPHVRGAVNPGASGAEIEAVLRVIEEDLGAEQRRLAEEQWLDVKRRKL